MSRLVKTDKYAPPPLKPQAGKQSLFLNIKDDGADKNGTALGQGDEIDYVFYGGGKNHCLPTIVI